MNDLAFSSLILQYINILHTVCTTLLAVSYAKTCQKCHIGVTFAHWFLLQREAFLVSCKFALCICIILTCIAVTLLSLLVHLALQEN